VSSVTAADWTWSSVCPKAKIDWVTLGQYSNPLKKKHVGQNRNTNFRSPAIKVMHSRKQIGQSCQNPLRLGLTRSRLGRPSCFPPFANFWKQLLSRGVSDVSDLAFLVNSNCLLLGLSIPSVFHRGSRIMTGWCMAITVSEMFQIDCWDVQRQNLYVQPQLQVMSMSMLTKC